MNMVNQRESNGVTVSVDTNKESVSLFVSQLEKFKKEAERLKQIDNVHVVKVHDLFEENGTAYYTMDFVEGYDLNGRLKRRGVPYAEKTVLNYLTQVLDGLAAIHSARLLHLDIKPSNIMVNTLGHVKLIDLGASKDYTEGAGATIYSGIARTNRYAPPEQMDGTLSKCGPWTDFYALGATLYYLLTYHEIPTHTDIQDDKSIDKHIALPMPNVSTNTKKLVVWLMHLDREKRPQSVEEIKKWMDANKQAAKTSLVQTATTYTPKDEKTVIAKPKLIPQLEVSKDTLCFDANENLETLVVIKSNINWEIHCDCPWVHLGKGGMTVCVRVKPNPDNATRTTIFTIGSENIYRKITIRQAGNSSAANANAEKTAPVSTGYDSPKEYSIFSFKGRTGLAGYWVVLFFLGFITLCYYGWLHSTWSACSDTETYLVALVATSCPIYCCYVMLATGARRCHDLGHSGWFQIIPFYFLIMLSSTSNEKCNKYGESNCKMSQNSENLFILIDVIFYLFFMAVDSITHS